MKKNSGYEMFKNCSAPAMDLSKNPTVELYRMQRSMVRILKTVSRICPSDADRKAFNAALKNVILEEKDLTQKHLLNHIKMLARIKAPKVIKDAKKDEYNRVSKMIEGNTIPVISRKVFSSIDDKDQMSRDLHDLTTDFVNSSWPLSLSADHDSNLDLIET